MPLPNPGMDFTALDVLPAESLDKMVANIEALAAGTGLNDGSITNAKLSTTPGQPGGVWAFWTPTWTNLTVGNGTVEARYVRVGKTVICSIRFTMGSTSVMGPDPAFTLPVPASPRFTAPTTRHNLGSLYVEDAGVAGYLGDITSESSTHARPRIASAAGTWLTSAPITSAQPMVWAVSDFFAGVFTYEAA
jgi:hypothetical protein